MSINYETNILFRNHVESILKLGKLRSKTIALLLDSKLGDYTGLQLYSFAYTHKSIDEINALKADQAPPSKSLPSLTKLEIEDKPDQKSHASDDDFSAGYA